MRDARARKLITLSKYRRTVEQKPVREPEAEAAAETADDSIRIAAELRMLEELRAALSELESASQTVHREPLRTDYEEIYGV